jgi:hypothetical protein
MRQTRVASLILIEIPALEKSLIMFVGVAANRKEFATLEI